ncbi:hypothetical protein BROUX41_005962 [Berkeleyomyces rouxiae]|uniref:uncharacterized protein n=1 Tax=Berkeleyomyces rouxiae TaxID=2035830 RepID=UPI003B784237
MPTYLCHGFRWYRNNVRVFAQFQDIEDAAPDWIIREGSSHAMLYTLYELFEFLPFAEDLVPAESAAAAVGLASALAASPTAAGAPAGVASPTTPTTPAAAEASAPRLLKKRSRARFLNKLSMFTGNSSSSSANAAAPTTGSSTPIDSPLATPVTPAALPSVYQTGELLGKNLSESRGLVPTDDEAAAPAPSTLPQPPIVPKILLPPGSETIVLPDGVKPPAMPPPPPPHEEAKARVVRSDPADPVLRNNDWAAIRLLEEWDARASLAPGQTPCSRPWAFVADYAVRIDLSARVTDEIARYERWCNKLAPHQRPMGGGTGPASGLEDDPAADRAAREAGFTPKPAAPRKPGWFQMLRDNMEFEGAIQWYIVVCEDEMRDFPVIEDETPIGRIDFSHLYKTPEEKPQV